MVLRTTTEAGKGDAAPNPRRLFSDQAGPFVRRSEDDRRWCASSPRSPPRVGTPEAGRREDAPNAPRRDVDAPEHGPARGPYSALTSCAWPRSPAWAAARRAIGTR